MTFGGFERSGSVSQPMAEINVTPMVDVMLVLLVIFIITAPLLTYALRLDLPDVTAPQATTPAEPIKLGIDAGGTIFFGAEPVPVQVLRARLADIAKQQPQREVHLRADKAARFEQVAQVMAAAQEAGLTKIGFVTEPAAAPADQPATAGTAARP